jgi:hypothetical protein
MNASCASPPEISCWNSTKRLVGPGCAKDYEWAGLDEGLLALSLPVLVYMENPCSDIK